MKDTSLPNINGMVDLTAKASGVASRTSSYDVNFNGIAHAVTVNENAFGLAHLPTLDRWYSYDAVQAVRDAWTQVAGPR